MLDAKLLPVMYIAYTLDSDFSLHYSFIFLKKHLYYKHLVSVYTLTQTLLNFLLGEFLSFPPKSKIYFEILTYKIDKGELTQLQW